MTKVMIAGLMAVALLVPGSAFAKKPADAGTKNAAKECKAEREAMGSENFALVYGSNKNKKNAFGKCVSRNVREEADEAEEAFKNASKACKAEEAADPAAFALKYGTNANGKNAHGKCVSGKAKQLAAESDEAELDAVRECRAEQKADPAAFTAAHGTNKNGRNAFGKCVSSQQKATS
jgi:hypothetical protein